ncbi:flp pilus-assembly TadE/G-like family protein [Actinomadura graeca]|uniref:Flp pilus-assembly TadE/G-like family protein n=1 Tax=Actinomadura graeca TaxID=2750812 RepID=A0ABX8QWF1_9ACTN|nr:flp pilus-assembly TadE/G-like family protein [Actinomadura graeca]
MRKWLRIGERDRGSGTLWVVAFTSIIWLGGVTAMAVGGVRTARHRGDAAADLAALAGAARVSNGAGAACASARSIAAESGARVTRCAVEGPVVDVSVTMTARVPLGIDALCVVSRARAGPVGLEGVA